MKCPLSLRGISIPGGRPGSNAGGSSTETEARLSQAMLLFHMQPPTVKLKLFFFFFLKERNRLKFPSLDRHQHVGWGNSGSTACTRAQTSSIPRPPHLHAHILSHTHTHTVTCSHFSPLTSLSLYYSLSLNVAHSFLLVIQSVPISVTQPHSLILSSNPIFL